MKKLPRVYRMDVVDGRLVFSAPSSKVQKSASVAPVEIAPSASLKQKVSNQECKQCKKSFSPRPRGSRGAPQIYCTVKCRTKYNNDKNAQRYKGGDKECLSCTQGFKQKKETQLYCSSKCQKREEKRRWHQKRITVKPSSKVTGAFVAKVEAALATLPPEEKLSPPIPTDKSASSLLSAGRTLTEVGLSEAVKDLYGVEIKDQPLRSRSFWFAILLAKHSKDLQDWRDKLEKHGLKSKPSVEKWLLFQGAASSNPSASGLKARLGI